MKNESDVTPPAEEKPDLDDGTLRGETNIRMHCPYENAFAFALKCNCNSFHRS